MEEIVKCKKLTVCYKDASGILATRKDVYVSLQGSISVSIKQNALRMIEVVSGAEIEYEKLYVILSKVERLLYILDGCFYELESITLVDSENSSVEKLNSISEHIKSSRLSCFKSADFLCTNNVFLSSYEDVLTNDLYLEWEKVLSDLDISNQVFLYSLCDNSQPVDVRCAFMIELAEPILELVKQYTGMFPSLSPGEKGCTLKMCIDALITKYGSGIFDVETNRIYSKMLSRMVNSRVRIMHIKKNQGLNFFNRNESILYSVKLQLLYRKIILNLLGVPETEYYETLCMKVNYWNKWQDVLDNLVYELEL